MALIQTLTAAEMPWRKALQESLRTADDLAREGLIARADIPAYATLLEKYRFLLPKYYADLIDRNNPLCPIRLQAIPDPRELRSNRLAVPDPLQDLQNQPTGRITHRYGNRLLLHLTPNCSMYCRFCFRKTLLNELSEDLFAGSLEHALTYISVHSNIEEVIFSGGDPLMSSSATLHGVVRELAKFPHLERIRFHTRVPVTFPSRIDTELIQAIAASRFAPIVVTHFNHPKEITAEALAGCQKLIAGGARLLNQSVLLRGVNDQAATLISLSKGLFSAGIIPYYLHHPDPAEGTDHFATSEIEGLKIYNEMRAQLSGYLVPKYVVDRMGRPYKSLVGAE